jgi:hypothetical protein
MSAFIVSIHPTGKRLFNSGPSDLLIQRERPSGSFPPEQTFSAVFNAMLKV